jgi:hypothetical protein
MCCIGAVPHKGQSAVPSLGELFSMGCGCMFLSAVALERSLLPHSDRYDCAPCGRVPTLWLLSFLSLFMQLLALT